jgi:AraC-like DNA-binding protein
MTVKKSTPIPVKHFADEDNSGISIEKISVKDFRNFNESQYAHRHNCHSFLLLENGNVSIEIDFKKHEIKSPSIIYMHPNQVHLIREAKNVIVSNLAITDEKLNPEYLKLIEGITPTEPILLKEEAFSIISETVSLCIKFSERKHRKLFHSSLKDSCNALVALFVSQYLELSKSADKRSRFENINNGFNEMLERNYITAKRPAEYAKKLNISTPYLNECVRNTTGHPVSHHIQQRNILEAKRLLYHSNKSVKEVAIELGYDDYRYFSRLFAKVTGMSPLSFRNQERR